MVDPMARVIVWAMCALGALTGLAFAVYLGAGWEPLESYVHKQFGDPVYSVVNRQLDIGLFTTGILAGAVLGVLIGLRVGSQGRLTNGTADTARLLLAAAGAYLWVCLWTMIGIATGGAVARAGDGLPRTLDGLLREFDYGRWGAIGGSLVGYCLVFWVHGLVLCRAAMAAENQRLQDEVARLKQRRD